MEMTFGEEQKLKKQIVRIGILKVYRLLSPTALLSCKVAYDEEEDSRVIDSTIRRSSPRSVCGDG